jgi:glycosyltransferase involved in cell wall biosynthesis
MINEKPTITVILPCYNHEKYLEARIHSILNQTLPVSEIIFLDDASTDSSFQLAQSLLRDCSAEVVFCSNSENSGSPFHQWNKGIYLAKNPIIWIAETDDSCHPDLLERLYVSLITNNAILSYSQSRYISSESKDLGSAIDLIPSALARMFRQDFAMDGGLFNCSLMTARNSIPNTSAVLFFRSAYIDAGLANTSMRYCGDWDMWIRMASQGRVAFVAKELNFFRCHSTTTRSGGRSPVLEAESLACRFKAQLGCPSNDSTSVTLPWIIKEYIKPDSANIILTIRFLSASSLFLTYKCYRSIYGAPRITLAAWACIYFLVGYNTLSSVVMRTINNLRIFQFSTIR